MIEGRVRVLLLFCEKVVCSHDAMIDVILGID